ncbi:MAG TPA: hypothetical protein VMT52_15500 [Planctomycetota bacterium]|nr:hypothetical protein [Planctomycetota bacterium]
MAKQGRKEKGAGSRFIEWMEVNQKVIWVVLLAIIAWSFAFTSPWQNAASNVSDKIEHARIHGEPLTVGEYKRLMARIRQAQGILQTVISTNFDYSQRDTLPLPGPLAKPGVSWGSLKPEDYLAFKNKALQMGLRVSDAELLDYLKDLWQRLEAAQRAQMEVLSKPDPTPAARRNDFQQRFEIMDLTRKKGAELRAGGYWDPKSWAALVDRFAERSRVIPVRDIEETLRDIFLIAKLEEYVRSSVNVSLEDVYKRYEEERQARRFSWTELKLPEAVEEMVAKTISDEDVKRHYEVEKDVSLRKPASVKASWLLIPKDHIREETARAITDEDVKKHFDETRNEYRRPALLASEADFALRSAEEKAELDKQLFFPFEEVKEKVRESLIEKRVPAELRTFADGIRTRLNPPKPTGDAAQAAGEKPPATFDELVKEHPFMTTGKTGYVTSDEEARSAFGDAYFPGAINGWFGALRQGKALTPPPQQGVTGEKGHIFFANVEGRRADYVPTFAEAQAEVRKSLVRKQALDILDKAADAAAESINAGTKDLAAVAAEGLEIEVGGEKIKVPATPVVAAPGFLGKTETLRIPEPAKTAENEEEKEKEKTMAALEDDGEELTVAHAASSEILKAAFLAREKGKVEATSRDEAGAAYIVRYDDLRLPNPAGFKDERDNLDHLLLREKQDKYFDDWRKDLYREAFALSGTSATPGT